MISEISILTISFSSLAKPMRLALAQWCFLALFPAFAADRVLSAGWDISSSKYLFEWQKNSPAPPLRAEARIDFPCDRTFLSDGRGVQLFFELISRDVRAEDHRSFNLLRPLDKENLWDKKSEPLYVLASRLAFVVDKDISFFSESRLQDEDYLTRLLPAFQIKRISKNGFRSDASPKHQFEISYFDREASREAWPRSLLGTNRFEQFPDVVLVQHNHGFEKVLGFKTARMGQTLSLHYALGEGRTLVVAWSLSYLYNIPPFFLGGEARVLREARLASLALIGNLRGLSDSWSVR